MYPGIGAAATDGGYRALQYFGQYGLNDGLYPDSRGLSLPAVVLKPLVSNMEKIAFDAAKVNPLSGIPYPLRLIRTRAIATRNRDV